MFLILILIWKRVLNDVCVIYHLTLSCLQYKDKARSTNLFAKVWKLILTCVTKEQHSYLYVPKAVSWQIDACACNAKTILFSLQSASRCMRGLYYYSVLSYKFCHNWYFIWVKYYLLNNNISWAFKVTQGSQVSQK